MGRRRRGGSVLSTTSAKGDVRVQEPSAAERVVARRAAESRATIPMLELSVQSPGGPGLSTGRLVRACALALHEHPRANGAYRDGHYELYSRVNIGVLIAREDQYLIPTVFDADTRSTTELDGGIGRLESDERLPASAFSGATFTVWNAAVLRLASASIPVVPPQAAVLAAGTRTLTLCCDHRILYGARAAAFLKAIADHLDRDGA